MRILATSALLRCVFSLSSLSPFIPLTLAYLQGEAHLCDWEGAEPLYKVRNEADTEELKNQVRLSPFSPSPMFLTSFCPQVSRLESLVRYLTSQRKAEDDAYENNSAFGAEEGAASPHSSVVQFPSKVRPPPSPSSPPLRSNRRRPQTARQYSGSQASQPPTPRNTFAMDLRANDLCEGLAQLAIKEFVVVEGSGTDSWAPGNIRGLEFVKEAKQFITTMPQAFGVAQTPSFTVSAGSRTASLAGGSEPAHSPAQSVAASSPASILSPSPLGIASFHKEAPPLSDVLKFLPSHKQAMSAYTYFAGSSLSLLFPPLISLNSPTRSRRLRLVVCPPRPSLDLRRSMERPSSGAYDRRRGDSQQGDRPLLHRDLPWSPRDGTVDDAGQEGDEGRVRNGTGEG